MTQSELTTRPLRIGIMSDADVRNFGDVLFPLVVAREVGARIPSATFEFVTCTGSSWAGMDSVRLDHADFSAYDAVILGGGEIVHRFDDMLRGIFAKFGLECIDRPTDFVFGWTDAAVPFKAWLSLGVPNPTPEVCGDIQKSVRGLQFISARGMQSLERLKQNGAPNTQLTPDLGWLFPRLLAGRQMPPHPSNGIPYIAVQALGFQDVVGAAAALQRVSKSTGLAIVLLPLTRCWQDASPLGILKQYSNDEFILVDDDMSDLDKLAILGGASLYIGQSMHGLIGAWSQGRPGGICLPDLDDKFGELLRDTRLEQYRSSSHWDGVEALAQTLIWSPLGLVAERRASATAKLDIVFDEMTEQLLNAVACHHAAAEKPIDIPALP